MASSPNTRYLPPKPSETLKYKQNSNRTFPGFPDDCRPHWCRPHLGAPEGPRRWAILQTICLGNNRNRFLQEFGMTDPTWEPTPSARLPLPWVDGLAEYIYIYIASAWTPNSELMQSLLCTLCYAIFAMQSSLCNLNYAIFAMQSQLCNLC